MDHSNLLVLILTCRVLSLFCSNLEDFGIEDMDKDPIFDSLKNITQLPPSPSKNEDRSDASAVRTAESPAIDEGEGKKSPVASTGE